MVKLLIVGPNGNMGRALVKSGAKNPNVDLVGAVGPKGRPYIGSDLGLLVGLGTPLGVSVSDDLERAIEDCDVALECTKPSVSMEVLQACLKRRKAFATGTTGFTEAQEGRIQKAGESIPVLRASNGSPIVHLLFELVRLVSERVGEEADIDVIEMHARTKPDAPSGTAREIAGSIAETVGLDLDQVAEHGRVGMGTRGSSSIQFSSIRSGGTPSTHRVIFGFQNERLELAHCVYGAEAFADGLMRGAVFVAGREAGTYGLEDALQEGRTGA